MLMSKKEHKVSREPKRRGERTGRSASVEVGPDLGWQGVWEPLADDLEDLESVLRRRHDVESEVRWMTGGRRC